MTDPLSITIAAGSLLTCCYKITKFVKTVYTDNKEIDQKAERFAKHVDGLMSVLDDLKENFEDPLSKDARGGTGIQAGHWDHVETILKDCHQSLQGMEKTVDAIEGDGKKGGFKGRALKQARFYFKEDELAFRRKEVETYTLTLNLSLQTISISYSETTMTRLDEMSRQLENVHKMLKKLSSAASSAPAKRTGESLDNLKQCAASAKRIISSASTVIGGGSTIFGSEYGTYLTTKRRKEMEDWIKWPDASTVASEPSATLVHSVTGSSATAAHPSSPGHEIHGHDHLEAKDYVHEYESKSEASSNMEEGILGRLIGLAREQYDLEEYQQAENFLEYALKQANTQDIGTDATEIKQEHARLREMLEMLCQCYEKLKDWDRAEMILGKLEQMPGATESQTMEMTHIMAEMHLERNQLDQAVEACKRVVDGKRKLLSKAHPSLQQSALLLAKIHEARGDSPLAEATLLKYLPANHKRPTDKDKQELQNKGSGNDAIVTVIEESAANNSDDEVHLQAVSDTRTKMTAELAVLQDTTPVLKSSEQESEQNARLVRKKKEERKSRSKSAGSDALDQRPLDLKSMWSDDKTTRTTDITIPDPAPVKEKRKPSQSSKQGSPSIPKIRKTSADKDDVPRIVKKPDVSATKGAPLSRSNSSSKRKAENSPDLPEPKSNILLRARSNSSTNQYSAKGEAFRRKSDDIGKLWMSEKVNDAAEEGTKYLMALLNTDLRQGIKEENISDFLRKNADQGFASSEDEQQNPIHLLSMAGLRDHISVLLDKNVNIDLPNEKYYTPLYLASKFGHTKTVELLVDRGANPVGRSRDQRTALHAACRDGRTETAKYLLDRGFEIEATTTHGSTPLVFACRHDHTQTVQMLLSRGANINTKMKDGSTPASVACGYGAVRTAEFLIMNGASIRTRHGSDELSPFLLAAYWGHSEVVAMLLSKGANITEMDRKKRTALHHAVQREKVAVIETLVKRGADMNRKDADGKTPIKIAKKEKSDAIVDALKSSQKRKSFFFF